MRNREKISFTDSTMDVLLKMSEGNPGAITALAEILKIQGDIGLMSILSLDDMGMRGAQIWVAYKDHCKQDLTVFIKAIDDRDPEMIATVNASRGVGDAPPARQYGASFA